MSNATNPLPGDNLYLTRGCPSNRARAENKTVTELAPKIC
jgi:hypothetical protein